MSPGVGDSTVAPEPGARVDAAPQTPARPFVWFWQLCPFGTSGAHRSAREQNSAIDLRRPLPVTPCHGERRRRIHCRARPAPMDGGTDGPAARGSATGDTRGTGRHVPPRRVLALPTQAAPCGPGAQTAAHTALARQTAPATRPTRTGGTVPSHGPPSIPILPPRLAWSSRKTHHRHTVSPPPPSPPNRGSWGDQGLLAGDTKGPRCHTAAPTPW